MNNIFAKEAARDQVLAASWHRDARRNYEAGNYKEAVRRQLWAADQYAQARAGRELAFEVVS